MDTQLSKLPDDENPVLCARLACGHARINHSLDGPSCTGDLDVPCPCKGYLYKLLAGETVAQATFRLAEANRLPEPIREIALRLAYARVPLDAPAEEWHSSIMRVLMFWRQPIIQKGA